MLFRAFLTFLLVVTLATTVLGASAEDEQQKTNSGSAITESRPVSVEFDDVSVERKLPSVCKPAQKITKSQCKHLKSRCASQGQPMKWTGRGCRINGKIMGDGGCQCSGYCGYQCQGACNRDPECYWNAKNSVCHVNATGEIGKPIPSCLQSECTPIPRESQCGGSLDECNLEGFCSDVSTPALRFCARRFENPTFGVCVVNKYCNDNPLPCQSRFDCPAGYACSDDCCGDGVTNGYCWPRCDSSGVGS